MFALGLSCPRPRNAFDLVMVFPRPQPSPVLIPSWSQLRGEEAASSASCSDLKVLLAVPRALSTTRQRVAHVSYWKSDADSSGSTATAFLHSRNFISHLASPFYGSLQRRHFLLLGKEGGGEGSGGGVPTKKEKKGKADAARQRAIVFSPRIRHPSYLC